MAKQTIYGPQYDSQEFNTGDSSERGDSPKEIVDKLNAMFTELYAADVGTGIGNGTAGTGIGAAEGGNQVTHVTTLTMTALAITLTDDAGVGQYSGTKLYDFPAGNILVVGAVVDADLTLNETWWTDAAAGDVGIGSVVTANGQALATTKQNIIATTEIAPMTAQVGPIDAQSIASVTLAAAGGTDADAYLNIRIDDSAAHMPDVVTNGAFASDTGWTKGTGWTIAAGVATSDASQVAVSDLSQTPTLVDGVTYKLTFTMTRSAGTITPLVGGTAGTVRSSAATFVEDIVAGATDTLAFRASEDFAGTIDNAILTPLTGTGAITGTVQLTWINMGDIA